MAPPHNCLLFSFLSWNLFWLYLWEQKLIISQNLVLRVILQSVIGGIIIIIVGLIYLFYISVFIEIHIFGGLIS